MALVTVSHNAVQPLSLFILQTLSSPQTETIIIQQQLPIPYLLAPGNLCSTFCAMNLPILDTCTNGIVPYLPLVSGLLHLA